MRKTTTGILYGGVANVFCEFIKVSVSCVNVKMNNKTIKMFPAELNFILKTKYENNFK